MVFRKALINKFQESFSYIYFDIVSFSVSTSSVCVCSTGVKFQLVFVSTFGQSLLVMLNSTLMLKIEESLLLIEAGRFLIMLGWWLL